jgi:hypothetical protein
MRENNAPRIGVLSCFINQDSETSLYLAHCLNFDLMECGRTPDDAWEALKTSVKQYIEYSYSSHPEGLSKSASAEEWRQFAEALKHSTKPPRVDTIEFELRPPLLESSAPIWMQGVSEDAAAGVAIQ